MKQILTPLALLLSLLTRTARADEVTGSGAAGDPPAAAEGKPAGYEAQRARFAEQQRFLQGLWIFASLNYLYCDVIGLMDAKMLRQFQEGKVDGMTINENFLLGGAILMQVPMSMVFLSTTLSPRASRVANIAAGALMTTVQTATLFLGKPSSYYAFSSAVEIATTGFITGYALFAMKPPSVVPSVEARKDAFALKLGVTF